MNDMMMEEEAVDPLVEALRHLKQVLMNAPDDMGGLTSESLADEPEEGMGEIMGQTAPKAKISLDVVKEEDPELKKKMFMK